MAKKDAKNKSAPEEEEAQAGEETLSPETVKKRLPGKVIILYIALPLLLLLLGGGPGLIFWECLVRQVKSMLETRKLSMVKVNKNGFYDLPEILVNLNTAGKKETYLKIRIALELDDAKTQTDLEPLMPRVVDNFQVFLREMRVEDLSGSAGMVRLKEELLQRINLSVQPVKVRDVLFKEMLIQ